MSKKIEMLKNGEPQYILSSHRFVNLKPLIVDPCETSYQKLPFDNFPLIEDFDIFYVNRKGSNFNESQICFLFYSQKFGILNSFPYWHIKEPKVKDLTIEEIPVGSLKSPFFDIEQGGAIYILEKRNHVYVLSSVGNEYDEFRTWYKVNKEVYISRWQEIISYFRTV